MNRRNFVRNLSLATAGWSLAACSGRAQSESAAEVDVDGKVMTVLGPIAPEAMGLTLPHEHILVDFIGAEEVSPDRYEADAVAARAIPHLRDLHDRGIRSFVECTPAYLGRDVALMKRISEETGVHILTNTGYYAAREGKFVPPHAYREDANHIAERWIAEFFNGIEGTDIRPGFIKTAVDPGALTGIESTLIHAAAITHKATGLTIGTHTPRSAEAGMAQLDILEEHGVHPSAWIWIHANRVDPVESLRPAFEAGAWISFDALRPNEESVTIHLDRLTYAKENGWLDQVHLSHDAGWYDPAQPEGGRHRPYTTYFTHFREAALQRGFTEADLQQISVTNPAKAFTIRRR